ncbi:MAG: thioredoxin family protein [Saprospiraceae bacterium]|nr:thioredoxin family protein [Saprospiraceae bacterium]MCB9308630.1 thioredoxin family protein [Lewinellaceae bacterium]
MQFKIFRYFIYVFLIFSSVKGWSQSKVFNPVKWSFKIEHIKDNEYKLIYRADIENGWTVYSQYTSDEGPVPTSINYEEKDGIQLLGKATESGSKKEGHDKYFDVDVVKFLSDKPFVIEQKIKVIDPKKHIMGYVNFMSCDHEKCLPPTDEDFTFTVPPSASATTAEVVAPSPKDKPVQPATQIEKPTVVESTKSGVDTTVKTIETKETPPQVVDTGAVSFGNISAKITGNQINQQVPTLLSSYKNPLTGCGGEAPEKSGYLWTFIFGFIGGLFALLTPCVFPMLPITISFFTKDTKRKGWVNGLIYAASIIIIYVVIGLLITIIAGPEALNRLSTNWIANTLFFIIFIIFAFSFFGFYEITLPSSWSTKSDRMADKGGLIGIFFMAFTLALVSFSCTGPIIGTALVEASSKGEYMGPFLVMLGFSSALALPFGLFAAFPAWLNTLPKSGSWMNSVKVVLGFLELALALKFLSTADLTNGWGFLRYELFMGLWVLVFIGMALYLFGFIKFPHDSPLKKLSPLRIGFGVLAVAAVIYLLSGFKINETTKEYNALSLMSGLAPPSSYTYFLEKPSVDPSIKAKYMSYTKCANNINCFKDYFEGMNYAKEVGKPVMLDFTGYGCVNCRKTEEHIWVDERVRKILNDSLVLISLYVDDDTPVTPVYSSEITGQKLRNVGKKWADFQIVNFEQNSQPLYVITSNDQQVITRPRPFVEGIDGYLEFLECSLKSFRELNPIKNE